MAEFPALPLWTDAYLADCSHLSDQEHGRYLQILFAMWRAPSRRLPNDDAWLARKFSRPIERVRDELRPIISEFCITDGNWITQKRLITEWEYVSRKSHQRSVAAKQRWQKEKDTCGSNADTYTPRIAPTPTPTPTPTKTLNGENGVKAKRQARSKPRHGATGNGRVWLDVGTTEYDQHEADYIAAHGHPPQKTYNNAGCWFVTNGEAHATILRDVP